jgi:hypothetical protein
MQLSVLFEVFPLKGLAMMGINFFGPKPYKNNVNIEIEQLKRMKKL